MYRFIESSDDNKFTLDKLKNFGKHLASSTNKTIRISTTEEY